MTINELIENLQQEVAKNPIAGNAIVTRFEALVYKDGRPVLQGWSQIGFTDNDSVIRVNGVPY
jgi:hypothetical protein